jgi:DNA polymerase-1
LCAVSGIERGIEIAAPVHDAFLVVAPLDKLSADVAAIHTAMAEAPGIVLDGFELRSDAKLIPYPDRFMDESRGRAMWERVMRLIGGCNSQATRGWGTPGLCRRE